MMELILIFQVIFYQEKDNLSDFFFDIEFKNHGPLYSWYLVNYRKLFSKKFSFKEFHQCCESIKTRNEIEIWIEPIRKNELIEKIKCKTCCIIKKKLFLQRNKIYNQLYL